MSDVTRGLISDILKIVFWLGAIGIIGWFGYQAYKGMTNWQHLAIAVVVWLFLGFAWRWVRLPLHR
jgi:hypothetical protein